LKKKVTPSSPLKSLRKRKSLPLLLQKVFAKESHSLFSFEKENFFRFPSQLFSSTPSQHPINIKKKSSKTGILCFSKLLQQKVFRLHSHAFKNLFKKLFIGTDLGMALVKMSEDKALPKGIREEEVERGKIKRPPATYIPPWIQSETPLRVSWAQKTSRSAFRMGPSCTMLSMTMAQMRHSLFMFKKS